MLFAYKIEIIVVLSNKCFEEIQNGTCEMRFLTHIRKGLREIRRPILSLSFDAYLFLFGNFLFFLLRKGEIQNPVLEACLDVLLGDVFADIEASLH